jgi:hypothetical protein
MGVLAIGVNGAMDDRRVEFEDDRADTKDDFRDWGGVSAKARIVRSKPGLSALPWGRLTFYLMLDILLLQARDQFQEVITGSSSMSCRDHLFGLQAEFFCLGGPSSFNSCYGVGECSVLTLSA